MRSIPIETTIPSPSLLIRAAWLFGFGMAMVTVDVSRAQTDGPFMATGVRIFEVDADSAVIWTRLTRDSQRVGDDRPLPEVSYEDNSNPRQLRRPIVSFPNGSSIATIAGAVPGASGQVRVRYQPQTQANDSSEQMTEWVDVDPDRDYIAQVSLTDLEAGTAYRATIEGRATPDSAPSCRIEAEFATAAPSEEPARVVFAVSTGQAYNDRDGPEGYRIYPAISALEPDFFVHTGDIVYYDRLGKSPALARWHWQRTYSLPTNLDFHQRVPSYFIKDDHDVLVNDCWPTIDSTFMGSLTFEDGQAIFREQAGMLGESPTYRTIRWGRDLQIWLVEGRDYRSPNPEPDGPDKTIWGAEQKAWFFRTVSESDATFRILISPTPVVGPDRTNKNDNHSNRGFITEGNELRRFLADQRDMVVVCGDRHWQYHSIDPVSGLREYSCGPASDAHAGGWRQDDFRPDYHRYLEVSGGFLSVTVDRDDDGLRAAFRFHDSDGDVRFKDIRRASE